jgi:hypothetical protein
MERFFNPRNDWMFKTIFGSEPNKDILIDFLNAVFEGVQDPIEDVTFLPTHQNPEVAAFRQTLVDVACTDTNKKQFIVEMQHYGDPFFIKRACIYASRAYTGQLKMPDPKDRDEGISKAGINKSAYSDIKPVTLLAILDSFPLIEGDSYISHNAVLDIDTHANNIKEFSYSFIRLDKFRKTFDESIKLLDKWCYFFKNAEITSLEDLAKIKDSCPFVSRAYDVLNIGNYTQQEYEDYFHYQMCADAHESCVWGAREEGEAKGKAEGLKQAACSMLAEGMSPEVVSRCARLSLEEVMLLLK